MNVFERRIIVFNCLYTSITIIPNQSLSNLTALRSQQQHFKADRVASRMQLSRIQDWEIDASDMEDRGVVIGRGSSGTVYKIRIGGVVYACKKLFVGAEDQQEKVQKYLLKEAKTLAQLRHPNIIQLFGVCLPDNSLVMEYADQGTVRDELNRAMKEPSVLQNVLPPTHRLHKVGQLSGWRKFEILHQVVLAMQAVHQKGALHQDIKPSNCMVVQGGTVKLGDFGLASGLATTRSILTGSGCVRGRTTTYAAPELLKGRAGKPAVDIYAFGVMVVGSRISRPAPNKCTKFSLLYCFSNISPPTLSGL